MYTSRAEHYLEGKLLKELSTVELRAIVREFWDKYETRPKSLIISMTKPECLTWLYTAYDDKAEVEVAAWSKQQDKTVLQTGETMTANTGNDALLDIIAQGLNGKIKAGLDEERVRAICSEMITKIKPNNVVINRPDGTKVQLDGCHFQFEYILQRVVALKNVMLVGPAGCGKTSIAKKVADALGAKFTVKSFSEYTTPEELVGFVSPTSGEFIPGVLNSVYQEKAVCLLDEIDAGNPNANVVIHTLADNGYFVQADNTEIKRNEEFYLIGAANTYGNGADVQYVGRNPIDGAFKERFYYITVDYDVDLELRLSTNEKWLAIVWKVRKAVSELKERVIVSTRAVTKGQAGIACGDTIDQALDAVIYKGINSDVKSRIENLRKSYN